MLMAVCIKLADWMAKLCGCISRLSSSVISQAAVWRGEQKVAPRGSSAGGEPNTSAGLMVPLSTVLLESFWLLGAPAFCWLAPSLPLLFKFSERGRHVHPRCAVFTLLILDRFHLQTPRTILLNCQVSVPSKKTRQINYFKTFPLIIQLLTRATQLRTKYIFERGSKITQLRYGCKSVHILMNGDAAVSRLHQSNSESC